MLRIFRQRPPGRRAERNTTNMRLRRACCDVVGANLLAKFVTSGITDVRAPISAGCVEHRPDLRTPPDRCGFAITAFAAWRADITQRCRVEILK